ncbi:MAG TPA: acetate/propionate family kinase [Arthrobacter bacterium]|jgi:acetate kinase|nr:acetate/propionate family kinase [Arthrobacter sp.]
MYNQTIQRILTINTGSSSLKVALFEMGRGETRILSGEIERIGVPGGRLRLTDAHGAILIDQRGDFSDHDAALEAVLAWLRQHRPELSLDAVGHRVVHGGIHYQEPQRVTPEFIAILQGMAPIAPDHLPQSIRAMQVAVKAYPNLPQVACSDTAFHWHMPRIAQLYPLPRHFADEGLIRYGFHGLSYEYIMQELRALAPKEAEGRVLIAHLGNGASMAAVRGGIGIDTTMGFTPAGGLMMGARAGDLDPGVLLYLLAEREMTPAALNDLVNRQAGLLGVSGISADMRDLLKRESTDGHAAEAVGLFCYQAKKYLGALATVLGGLDTLVFTGGIGEHAASVRLRICEGLEFLGIRIDPLCNEAHAPVISPEGSSATVRVMRTDEDLMIARHTRELMEKNR